MLILAIDTSTTHGSIALLRDEVCLEERTLQLGQAHGQTLIPAIRDLFADHRLQVSDCELVAVGTGPGSFTGLRVGIVCAKTWAYSTSCKLVGVSTFEAIATHASADVQTLDVIADAQREDLFVQSFQHGEAGWTASDGVRVVTITRWIEQLTERTTVIGPGLSKVSTLIPNNVRQLSAESSLPLAASTGLLGVRAGSAGRYSDPWTLEPLYLRRSAAEDTWDAREAARNATPASAPNPSTTTP